MERKRWRMIGTKSSKSMLQQYGSETKHQYIKYSPTRELDFNNKLFGRSRQRSRCDSQRSFYAYNNKKVEDQSSLSRNQPLVIKQYPPLNRNKNYSNQASPQMDSKQHQQKLKLIADQLNSQIFPKEFNLDQSSKYQKTTIMLQKLQYEFKQFKINVMIELKKQEDMLKRMLNQIINNVEFQINRISQTNQAKNNQYFDSSQDYVDIPQPSRKYSSRSKSKILRYNSQQNQEYIPKKSQNDVQNQKILPKQTNSIFKQPKFEIPQKVITNLQKDDLNAISKQQISLIQNVQKNQINLIQSNHQKIDQFQTNYGKFNRLFTTIRRLKSGMNDIQQLKTVVLDNSSNASINIKDIRKNLKQQIKNKKNSEDANKNTLKQNYQKCTS